MLTLLLILWCCSRACEVDVAAPEEAATARRGVSCTRLIAKAIPARHLSSINGRRVNSSDVSNSDSSSHSSIWLRRSSWPCRAKCACFGSCCSRCLPVHLGNRERERRDLRALRAAAISAAEQRRQRPRRAILSAASWLDIMLQQQQLSGERYRLLLTFVSLVAVSYACVNGLCARQIAVAECVLLSSVRRLRCLQNSRSNRVATPTSRDL